MSDKRIEISSEDLPDGVVIVRPVGKLDVFTFTELKKFIAEVCTAKPAVRMVVDLEQVEYIASSGWSVLLSRRQGIKREGGNLTVFGMSENLLRVYESMKIDKMLPSAPDQPGAIELVKAAE